jgi:hypothetical protein
MYDAFQLMGQTTLEHQIQIPCLPAARPGYHLSPFSPAKAAGLPVWSIVHSIRIDLAACDNAPYFTAFVARSLNAMPRAEAAWRRMFSHVIAIRSARPPTARHV